MLKPKIILPFVTIVLSFTAIANGNVSIDSFSKAKKILVRKIYHDHRETLYCAGGFDKKKYFIPPAGFFSSNHKKRSKKIEIEHVVPAQNFGQTFSEWRIGHNSCVNRKGKAFKGRRCAEKVNKEYRYMQADMHNLFPANGSVNAKRSNYNFTFLPKEKADFGSCDMRIENRKVQPPARARGRIARTYMYMEQTYPRYNMSKQQRKLMKLWDIKHPVSRWECTRAKRIEAQQGNTNEVVNSRCRTSGFL